MRLICGVIALLVLLPMMGCQSATTKEPGRTTEPAESKVPTQLTAMSFNIRNGKANDADNRWENRKELVRNVIVQYDADIIGLQEAFRFQLDYLAKELPGYSEIGEGRDGGTSNEYCAILYRTDRYTVLDSGTFWLSETPEVVSKHWKHFHHRICTWARLKDRKSGDAFCVFNTHFDHQSQLARVNSAKLIRQRIADRTTNDPVILTGDMNAGEDNPAIKILKRGVSGTQAQPLFDTFRVIYPVAKQVGTGNGGYHGKRDGAKIDYILIGPGIETLGATIDQEPHDGRYPSDHYPVIAKLRLVPMNARPRIILPSE